MDTYMYQHRRVMMSPRWKLDEWCPGTQIYKTLQQSATESWIHKTQVMPMITQTHEAKTIRPIECKEMLLPNLKLREQWKQKNHALLEQKTTRETATKNHQADKYVKKSGKQKWLDS